nr:plasmid pRiA4b ORF-3 family protein [Paenibacillus tyrfis]
MGGVWGHQQLLEVLLAPNHPEQRSESKNPVKLTRVFMEKS